MSARRSARTVARQVATAVPGGRAVALRAKVVHDGLLRAPTPTSLDRTVRAWLADVRRTGLSVVPGYLSASTCERLRAEVAEQMEAHASAVSVDSKGADRRLFLGATPSGELGTIFSDPVLLDAARGVLGRDVSNLALLAGWLRATPGNRGSGGGWHRDSYTNQFKAIVYLTDVDVDSGPFQYILGSHATAAKVRDDRRMGVEIGRRPRLPNASAHRLIDAEPDRLATVVAPRGSLILADTTGIHRGMPIRRGERIALTNYYYPRAVVDRRGFRPRFTIVTGD